TRRADADVDPRPAARAARAGCPAAELSGDRGQFLPPLAPAALSAAGPASPRGRRGPAARAGRRRWQAGRDRSGEIQPLATLGPGRYSGGAAVGVQPRYEGGSPGTELGSRSDQVLSQ